jgi:ankyrin repeat protein
MSYFINLPTDVKHQVLLHLSVSEMESFCKSIDYHLSDNSPIWTLFEEKDVKPKNCETLRQRYFRNLDDKKSMHQFHAYKYDLVDKIVIKYWRSTRFSGYSPISWAAKYGSIKVLKKIKQEEPRLFKSAQFEDIPPLTAAIDSYQTSNLETIEFLIDCGSKIDNDNICKAIKNFVPTPVIARMLPIMVVEDDLNETLDSLFKTAIYHNRIDILEILHNQYRDYKLEVQIYREANSISREMLRFLLEKELIDAIVVEDLLIYLTETNNIRLFDLLVEKKVNIHMMAYDGQNCLFHAHPEMIEYLLNKGIKPIVDGQNNNIFHYYYQKNKLANRDIHEKNFRLLIAAGADINHQGKYGRTPLMWGVGSRDCSSTIFDLLLKYGANPLIYDVSDNNAIELAIEAAENEKVIESLIDSCSSLNAQNQVGDTTLMTIVKANETEWVNYILSNHKDKLDMTLKNCEGETIFDCVNMHSKRMVEIFTSYGYGPMLGN